MMKSQITHNVSGTTTCSLDQGLRSKPLGKETAPTAPVKQVRLAHNASLTWRD
ncbi:MAG: hypothetical protein ACRCXB_20505 [Aeromonadaceae bacterium]|jgi:hypothetical protein|uniref:hypothetical protein n=1 Tax=Aeromonas sp. RU39B TaxID=1907416 RepID=UPI0015C3F373|nr:hypothetical protein [Aeromonas sp. RU39B]